MVPRNITGSNNTPQIAAAWMPHAVATPIPHAYYLVFGIMLTAEEGGIAPFLLRAWS